MRIADSNMLWKLRDIRNNFDEFAMEHTISYQQRKIFSTKSFNFIKIQPVGSDTSIYIVIVDKVDILSVDLDNGTANSDIFSDETMVKILQIFIEEAEIMMNETTAHYTNEKKIKHDKVTKKIEKLIKNHKL